jgi:phosphomannomutase
LHIAILRLAAREKKSVSELLDELPARFTASDRLREFPQEKSQAIIKKFSSGDEKTDKETISQVFAEICGPVQSIDRTDGVRITFADDNVVHLRPSGNAPEFRCYTESASEESAVSLNSKCMQILKNMT